MRPPTVPSAIFPLPIPLLQGMGGSVSAEQAKRELRRLGLKFGTLPDRLVGRGARGGLDRGRRAQGGLGSATVPPPCPPCPPVLPPSGRRTRPGRQL